MADDTLFDDPDSGARPDPAVRRAVRRQVLGGVLHVIRSRKAWSVNDAASQAGIAPMTWRRVEEGLEVRARTLTALDGLLGQPFGTVRRALDDDAEMRRLAKMADVLPLDDDGMSAGSTAEWLDQLAERFRSGTVSDAGSGPVRRYGSRPAAARAALGGLRARVGDPVSVATVGPDVLRGAVDRGVIASLAALPIPPVSDLTRAAQLVDHITRRQLTPALENAVAAILAAMPDLVTDRIDDALPAVDVLAESANRTLNQAAAEVARLATDRMVAAHLAEQEQAADDTDEE